MGKIYIMYVFISGQGRAGAGQDSSRAGQGSRAGQPVSQSALQVNRESIGLIDTHNFQFYDWFRNQKVLIIF